MPFRHNLADHRVTENLIVKVTTQQNQTGFGEGIPRDYVTGEKMSASIDFLDTHLWPQVRKLCIEHPKDIIKWVAEVLTPGAISRVPALCCALELALLDAAGKTWGMPVADFFGPKDQTLRYSAVLPITNSREFSEMLCLVRDAGMNDVKIKVGDDQDIDRLINARKILGSDVDIRVDANGAWKANEAVLRINEMSAFNISAVEQPVEKKDFKGLHFVAENTRVPLIVDESLCTLADAERLASLGSKVMFNLRLSKCGGMLASDRIHALGRSHGILSQLGCQVGETSILAAAGQQFALTHESRYLEGAYSKFLLKEDIVHTPLSFGQAGMAEPPSGPGLGIEVNEKTLERLASTHRIFA